MSKQKKFHNLIEQGNAEEKSRVWEQICDKEISPQSTPTPAPKKRSIFLTRKFLSWASGGMVALILCVVGIAQLLPKTKGHNDALGGGTQNGTMENIVSSSATTGVQSDFGQSGSNQETVTPESSSMENGAWEEDTGEDGNIPPTYTSTQYEEQTQESTLKTRGEGVLYLDWYDKPFQSFAYIEKQTGEILGYKESFTAAELGGEATLYTTSVGVNLEELSWGKELDVAKTVKGVTVYSAFWLVRPQNPEIKRANFYFRYGERQYFVQMQIGVSDVTEEDLWTIIEAIIP